MVHGVQSKRAAADGESKAADGDSLANSDGESEAADGDSEAADGAAPKITDRGSLAKSPDLWLVLTGVTLPLLESYFQLFLMLKRSSTELQISLLIYYGKSCTRIS